MFSTYKRVFWLSAIMTIFFFMPFYVDGFSTDVWTRLTRIKIWANEGFPLKETLTMTQNYPFGVEMHWTHPLDFIGYIFAWPFIPQWGIKDALEIMAWYTPILGMLLSVYGFFFGVKGYMTPKVAFFSFWLFFYGIGYSWGQASVGYFDHHIFHFCCLIWSIALLARSFLVQRNTFFLILAGIISACGSWMTSEFFINTYILIVPFLFLWLFHKKSLRPAIIYTTAYTLFLGSVLLFDHPIAGYFTLDFYRISFFHVLLGFFNILFLLFLSIPIFNTCFLRRLIYGMVGGLLLISILLFGFSDILLTPMVDPFMYHLWTKKVTEMKPLLGNYPRLICYAILPLLLAFCLFIWSLFHVRSKIFPLLMISIVGTFFYAFMIIFHVRVGISQNAFFVFLSACYFKIVFFPKEKSFYNSLLFILFYLTFIGCSLKGYAISTKIYDFMFHKKLEIYRNDPNNSILKLDEKLKKKFDKIIQEEQDENPVEKEYDHPEDKNYSCQFSDKIFDIVRNDNKNGSVFVEIFSAPELLWETDKPVLGGPYHTNIEGLSDLFRIKLDHPPFTETYDLLKKHQVTQVVLFNPDCLSYIYLDEKGTYDWVDNTFVYNAYYETEKIPQWLELEYYDKKKKIKVFRVKYSD